MIENYITLNQLKKAVDALLIKINTDVDTKVDKTSVSATLNSGTKIGEINGTELYAPNSLTEENVYDIVGQEFSYYSSQFADVAYSGSYNDLIDTPTIPVVSAWAQQPTKPTYTAAEVGALPDTTIIPTVPEWAQQPTKPTYTASEVGATDEKLKTYTAIVSGTTYYPILGTYSTTASTKSISQYFKYTPGELTIANGGQSKSGVLKLQGASNNYTVLQASSTAEDVTITLPATSGQLALQTSVINALNKTGDAMTGELGLAYFSDLQSQNSSLTFKTSVTGQTIKINSDYYANANDNYGFLKFYSRNGQENTDDDIILRGIRSPKYSTDAANKAYVDNIENNKVSKTGDTMTGQLVVPYNDTTVLGGIKFKTDDDYSDIVLSASGGYYDSSADITYPRIKFISIIGSNDTLVGGILNPIRDSDAANKAYVDNAISSYTYTETDPTVPAWAKASTKPTYTAAEVGALPDTYTAPVTSVNGQTGAVTIVADDQTWNGISLNKTLYAQSSSKYIPYIAGNSTTSTTAYYTKSTTTPTSDYIAQYDTSSYLYSTTPSANDNSTKVATTAYVDGKNTIQTTAASTNTEYNLLGTATTDTNTSAVPLYQQDLLSFSKTNNVSRLSIGSTSVPGEARLYSSADSASGYTDLKSAASSTNARTITFPDASGTVALTTDIPSISSWASAANKPSYTFSELTSHPTTINDYGITDAYTKTEVDGLVSGVLHYKGTKATAAALPSSGNVTGDVWHVTEDGSEWAWDGSEWQELGSTVDLSGYLQTGDIANWAKASTKPSYTASEVGALPSNTTYVSSFNGESGAITYVPPVTSVNGQTGAVTITDSDEKVKQVPLNGENNTRGILMSSGNGNATQTNSVYTTNKFQYNDYSGTLYLYNADRTNAGFLKSGTLALLDNTYLGIIRTTTLTDNQSYALPNKTGTIALTSDIPTMPTNVSSFTNDAGYLTSYTETDPVFSASAAANITSSDITNWNSKLSSYTETDPVFTASAAAGITASDITSWNNKLSSYTETDPTVPSWAKAASKPTYTASEVGAATSDHAHGNITNAGDITTNATIASGDRLIINDESASKIINSSITFGSSTTQYLANNGTWQNVPTAYDDTALAARVTALEQIPWVTYYTGSNAPSNSQGQNGDLYFQTSND